MPTTYATNRFTLKIGSTDYSAQCVSLHMVPENTGGDSITTADGIVHKTPQSSSYTTVDVEFIVQLETASLFQVLAATTAAGTEVLTWTYSTSATAGASNPKFTGTVGSWTKPDANVSASGGYMTATATFVVSSVTGPTYV